MQDLAKQLQHICIDRRLTLATAESCTGGLLATTLTSIPGSSQYLKGSVVAYADQSKADVLHVKKETLEKYGAVSEQTVHEMSQNVCKLFQTNIGIAISGIAGPDGGTDEKPVGLVYMAFTINHKTKTIKHLFSGDRQQIREQSAESALQSILDAL